MNNIQPVSQPNMVQLAERITDLSFVENQGQGRLFWSVIPTGRRLDEELIGRRYADEYLLYRRQGAMLPLWWIVRDMPANNSGLELGFLDRLSTLAMRGQEVMS